MPDRSDSVGSHHFGVVHRNDDVAPRVLDDVLDGGPKLAASNRIGVAVLFGECRRGKSERRQNNNCMSHHGLVLPIKGCVSQKVYPWALPAAIVIRSEEHT